LPRVFLAVLLVELVELEVVSTIPVCMGLSL
jgi:hypothetical protein